MIEFGNSLRTAREAKGYSISQLSELTRIAPSTLGELESENFTRIAAPIYGRGFVKLYCEAVGLDAKPYVDEFMEIYNGNRDTSIRERPLPNAAPTADVPPAPVEPLTSEEPPIPDEPPIASRIHNTLQASAPAREPEPEPDLFRQETVAENTTSEPRLCRYAAPLRQYRTALDIRACLRLGILVLIALFTLTLLVLGIRAVFRATTRSPENAPENVREEVPATENRPAPPTSPAAQEMMPRTPQKIPSLYID